MDGIVSYINAVRNPSSKQLTSPIKTIHRGLLLKAWSTDKQLQQNLVSSKTVQKFNLYSKPTKFQQDPQVTHQHSNTWETGHYNWHLNLRWPQVSALGDGPLRWMGGGL